MQRALIETRLAQPSECMAYLKSVSAADLMCLHKKSALTTEDCCCCLVDLLAVHGVCVHLQLSLLHLARAFAADIHRLRRAVRRTPLFAALLSRLLGSFTPTWRAWTWRTARWTATSKATAREMAR